MSARLASLAEQMRTIALRHARPRDDASRPVKPWYEIRNAADERAIVQIDGEIGWDVMSSSFAEDLRAITAPAIDLHINSPGGSAWDGYAIYNALMTHPATVTTHVVGIAASAASFIAMAGDEIVAYRPSEMMIHDAACYLDVWGLYQPADLINVLGEINQLKQSLDQTSDEIAAIYARKAGPDHGTVADWRARMQATNWYTPDAALAAGLVDRINGDDEPAGGDSTDSPAPGADGASDRVERFRARARATIVRASAPAQLRRGVN